MYGAAAPVEVLELEKDQRILIGWPSPVEWVFSPRGKDATFVTITASGFTGTADEQVSGAIDSMGGFSLISFAITTLITMSKITPDRLMPSS